MHIYTYTYVHIYICGFPDSSVGIESDCNEETWARSLGWEDSLKKGMATHSSILAWRIPWSPSPWGCKESDTTEQLSLSLLNAYMYVLHTSGIL